MYKTALLLKEMESKTKVNTIDIINQDVYEFMTEEASKKNTSLRKFTNEFLLAQKQKADFMKKYVPKLKEIAFEDGRMVIHDGREGNYTTITLKKGLVHCSLCDSNECIHVMFAFAMPDLGMLEPSRT
jgi:hypothetical protein